MPESEDNARELRQLRRMLKQMHNLAEHSSLTGSLAAGAMDAVEQYNRILVRLDELHVAPPRLFAPLPLDASFDRLGVASKLLEGFLIEEAPDTQRESNGGHKIIIGNNLGEISGLDELKDLGRVIRENLPDFLRRHTTPPEPPTPPTPPAYPFPPDPPTIRE